MTVVSAAAAVAGGDVVFAAVVSAGVAASVVRGRPEMPVTIMTRPMALTPAQRVKRSVAALIVTCPCISPQRAAPGIDGGILL